MRWEIPLSQCNGGSAMRKLMESLLLILTRIRRLIMGPR